MGEVDDIAARLDPTDVDAARTDALTIFGLMAGTLQLARARPTATYPINSSPAGSKRP
jgi:hypothetical protein